MQTIEKLLYEDTTCKIYTTPKKEGHCGKLIFELYVNEKTYIYEMSGHPYIPTITAECTNHSENSFGINGRFYFPDINAPQESWKKFCKDLSKEAYKYINIGE